MGRMGSGRRTFSASPADYKLLEEVGYGASATVYRAIYLPLNEVVAIKCLDLDRCNSNLDDIRKEAQTMSLIDHPNVVTAYCSFSVERCLWVVMPFMAEGSCLHLMKIAYPDGFEEVVIGSILKETLKALEYLHRHGHIHRDVKAGNILLDSNGVVKLGDFGVSACLFDKGDRQRSRNTFVGTPCWMAPEVLQPGSGYDFKADIWSFGITALELAHGHAPFSKYPPMKVLLMTIQNAPPGLDYDRDKRFSKAFKEMVAMCLVKDQTKRPTAEKLLKHSFFKHAKSPELSLKSILHDLPPLWDRVKALQLKDAAQLALKKMPSAEQEALSQSEYKRGVSAWNFDIEDLKAQASLVQDDDDMKEEDESTRMFADEKEPAASISRMGNSMSSSYLNSRTANNAECEEVKCSASNCEIEEIDVTDYAYQKSFDRHEKDVSSNMAVSSTSKKDTGPDPSKPQLGKGRLIHSGPLLPSNVVSQSLGDQDRSSVRSDADFQPSTDKYKREARKAPAPNFSGPLMLPNRASANSLSAPIRSSGGYRDSFEEKSKPNVIQVRGRFSITSEQVEHAKDNSISSASRRSSQGSPLRKSASVGDWVFDSRQAVCSISQSPKEAINTSVPASVLMPHLQNLFQQTAFQQDLIVSLLNSVQQVEAGDAVQSGKLQSDARNPDNDTAVESVSSERERLLLVKIQELQARMTNLTDELTAAKLKHVQLQQQLNAAYGREEERSILEDKES